MNKSERILALFGIMMIAGAIALAIALELTTRQQLTTYRQLVAAGAPIPSDPNKPSYAYHIAEAEDALAHRWIFPGHAALASVFTLIGLILIAIPRHAAQRRDRGGAIASP